MLRQYLVKGYAVNERLTSERYEELKDLVRVMARTIESRGDERGDETEGIVSTVRDYVYALDMLDSYDNQQLSICDTTVEEPFRATYGNKRIAATLFLWFMERNGLLYSPLNFFIFLGCFRVFCCYRGLTSSSLGGASAIRKRVFIAFGLHGASGKRFFEGF